jgi:outer membrane protein TolC
MSRRLSVSDLQQRPRRAAAAAVLAAVAAVGLSGCAMYTSRPLAKAPSVSDNPQRLKADLARLRLGPLKTIRIDPSDGLTPTEVAILAVLNNSELEARRRATRVSEAQVFAAGLLPDPQISGSVDNPVAGPDTQLAYSVAASIDLAGLMQRTYARRSARFTAREADLNVLWAEWGVAQQARQFAETALAAEARVVFLRQVLALAADRSDRSGRALERRDVNLQTAAADLAVKLDAQAQLTMAVHDAEKARRDLNALLNLRADVVLPLVAGRVVAAYDAAAVRQALADLPERRPDLLALKAGYAAQDVNVRKAVLAQFPLNNIGAAYAKDTAGVITQSLQAAFALPIFNGGRGEVRIQKATREQLHAEYQARLDQTDAEVRNAQAEQMAALRQAALLRQEVPRLEALVKPAVAAYDRGDLDSQTYLTLSQTALTRRADLDDKELAARLAEIALETALFLPPADSRAAQ